MRASEEFRAFHNRFVTISQQLSNSGINVEPGIESKVNLHLSSMRYDHEPKDKKCRTQNTYSPLCLLKQVNEGPLRSLHKHTGNQNSLQIVSDSFRGLKKVDVRNNRIIQSMAAKLLISHSRKQKIAKIIISFSFLFSFPHFRFEVI